MKLNLGAGYTKYPGYLTVDHDPLTNPDLLADLENLKLDIADNTVEEIIAHHVFEHIGPGFFSMLKEIYRVCCHGAVLDIKVPHHRSECFYGDPSHVRPITVDMMKHFSKKYNHWHMKEFNSSSGFGIKLDVDFEIVDFSYKPYDKWKARFEEMTNEEIDEIVMNFNNVFWETSIKMMVIKDGSTGNS